ncbi:MAG TPA: hypothetical protein VF116_03045 [Ktedonobacterales bacterium]
MSAPRTDPLLPTIRIVLVVLAATSGFLMGLSMHMVYDPHAPAIGFCGAGIVLLAVVQGWARISRIQGLGCLVSAVALGVFLLVAVL